MTDKTGRSRNPAPSPDQNDMTGRARPGSPTYTPADPPANNHRVNDREDLPEVAPTREEAEEEAKLNNEPLRDSANVG